MKDEPFRIETLILDKPAPPPAQVGWFRTVCATISLWINNHFVRNYGTFTDVDAAMERVSALEKALGVTGNHIVLAVSLTEQEVAKRWIAYSAGDGYWQDCHEIAKPRLVSQRLCYRSDLGALPKAMFSKITLLFHNQFAVQGVPKNCTDLTEYFRVHVDKLSDEAIFNGIAHSGLKPSVDSVLYVCDIDHRLCDCIVEGVARCDYEILQLDNSSATSTVLVNSVDKLTAVLHEEIKAEFFPVLDKPCWYPGLSGYPKRSVSLSPQFFQSANLFA